MKNLNFLTNWWCSGKTKHVITTLKPRQSQVNATWRFVAILTMLVTLGVGNAWGADPVATETATDGESYVVAAWTGSKYVALPNFTTGSTPAGVDITVNASGKVTTADAPEWTFTEGSTTGQFYLTYTSGVTTYYLYKNGTKKNNYNIAGKSNGDKNYWSFTKSSNKYKVLAIDRGSNNTRLTYYTSESKWEVYGTAKTYDIILLKKAAAGPAITPSVTELDWGTVNKGASLTTKTFTITGSNLTSAALVYSASGGYSVSPSGKAGAAGTLASQTLTVTPPSTATPGTYNSTVTVSGGGLSSAVSVTVKLTVQETDEFIDEIQSTSGYTSVSPHIEGGSYTTPKLSDKTPTTSGTCAQQHWHFVGWVPEDYKASPKGHITNGGTSGTADGTTYYAVWSKGVAGDSFDNTAGGEFYIYATINDVNYYATSISSSKLQKTTDIASATKFTFTKISNGVYSIYDGSAYLYNTSSSGTNLSTQASSFSWTISTGSYGSWRVVGDTRALIYRKSTYNYFGAYTTGSVNGTEYFDIEIGGATTYSDSIAVCCTPLGSINGSINMSSSTDGTVTISGWTYNAGSTGTTESNVSSYTVKLYKWNGSAWAIANASSTTGGSSGTAATRTGIATDSKSVTYSGLEYGGTYKFTVQAIGTGSYCDGEETAVTSINGNSLTDNKFLNKYYFRIDDGTQSDTGWENHYLASINASHVGTVNVTLTQDVDYYQYKLTLGGVIWWGNTGKMTSANHSGWTFTTGASNCKLQTSLGGTYTFSATVTTPSVTVTYPTANQASGKKIWFDKSVITGWTDADASQLYWRIGKPSHTTVNSDETANYFSLVPGTDRFYVYETKGYDGFEAWHIANNTAWSGSSDNNPDYDNHGIYTHYHNQSSTDVTRATVYQKYVVGNDGVTLVPTTKKNTDWYCDFWNVDKTDGMLTHNVAVSTAAHGTLLVTYTNTSGTTGQTVTEGNDADLAHRCILTITATPDDGYTCTSLTLNGDAFTSGNTHILTADATIAATFTAQTSTVTLDNNNATSGSSQTVTATYDAAMPLTTTTSAAVAALSRTGYTFNGWWDATSGGTQYYTYSGSPKVIASARTWDKTGAQTLKAQWSINSYTLTWNLGGRGKITTAGTAAPENATGTPHDDIAYNTAITVPVAGNANGYTFNGWSPEPASNMPAANTTYTAQWSANVYTVTLDNQSATTAGAASVSATFGQAMPSIASNLPAKTGYRFDGYYTKKNGDGTKYYNADGSSATNMAMYGANPTLYANWVAQIEFSVNGVVDDELTCDVTASLPSSATVPTSCGDCWLFAGWDESPTCSTTPGHAGGENAATHGITTPTTLYAVFGQTVFEWISSTSGLVDKDYYVLTNIASSKEYALSNTANPTYSSDAASTEVTDKIKENGAGYFLYNPAVNNIWKFTGTTSSGQLQNVGNTSLYLNLSGSGSILSITNNLTFTLGSNGEWKINSTKYLRHYSANDWDAAASLSEGKFSCYLYHQTSATYATEPSCETYDIVWKVDGTPLATGSQTEETNTCAGIEELPEDPDDDALDCATKFVGWSEEELVGAGHDAPADLFTSVGYAPAIEEDKTFHAVFATGTPIANTYVLGTIDDLKDGQTVILVNYANDVACKNTSSSTGTLDALDISSLIDDDVLTTDNTAVKWTVTKSGDYYVFKSGDNYLRCSGSSNLVCDATSDKWTITSGSVDGTYYMTSYNQSSYKFEYYNSKFTTYSGTGTAYNTVFYIPAESYSDYMTTCCDDVVTIGAPTITGSGTVTFASGGETLTEGDVVETCTASKTITATVTPAAGYSCTALSFTDGSSALTTSPTILSSVPFDAPTAKDYDMTFATNTTSMTLTTSATFSVKPLTAWTWGYRIDADAKNNTGDILPIPVDPIEAYIGQYVRFDITGYTPSDVIAAKQNYVYDQDANPKQPVYDTDELAHVGHSTGYYTTRGKAAGDATLIFKSVGNAEITQTMTIRVKALPTVTFVDNIHNKTDFAVTEGVLAAGGVLTSVVTTGVVDHDLKTPKHADVAMPVSGNECEQQHLHLVGWIYSEWSGAADYMAGTGSKPSVSALTGAKVGTAEGFPDNTPCFFEPNDDINMETWNGKTFYAVWAIVE